LQRPERGELETDVGRRVNRAVGAVMIIGSIDTGAQVASGALRVSHRIRF
jgi:hypothetical protein